MFEIGKQVVCINTCSFNRTMINWFKRKYIDKVHTFHVGDIYTVNEITDCGNFISLGFDEVKVYFFPAEYYVSYDSLGFRPCKETNIEVFSDILLSVPKLETVNV